ncbi:Acetyltransferase (GNAT) family protein [Octadecabacter temperatus]|uniref:Acetyltransferase (GNAT) family protein n=1 Tax=Octadecabacter temperatus TaxID=1458307 RepID=A0A0K0Y373_9RHOB|nr:GNAT family N-acetyltransferase [Octadecabacter temperatus]AKS45413.1 Acetyltransferase (GNAT) family protein [Octadecabacter temperatus]SIN92383.1 Acetyltransferase (GNAT) family protein [Octadecabacter temperatus]
MTDISFATRSDLPAIYDMICALCAYHGDEAQVGLLQLDDIFFGTSPTGTALIAKQGDTPLGYAGVTSATAIHERRPRLDIHHLFVIESHRARGIGKSLITAAKAHAISVDALRLTIGTDPGNETAIAAYRAMPDLEEITGSGPRFAIDLSPT